MKFQSGFGLAELVIVVGIIGILAGLILATSSKGKLEAHDVAVENAVRQMRFQAEIAYDSAGGTFVNWDQNTAIQNSLAILLEEADSHLGDDPGAPYATVIRNSQVQNYCVSAPSVIESGKYHCIDATGELQLTTAACPDNAVDGPALVCP